MKAVLERTRQQGGYGIPQGGGRNDRNDRGGQSAPSSRGGYGGQRGGAQAGNGSSATWGDLVPTSDAPRPRSVDSVEVSPGVWRRPGGK